MQAWVTMCRAVGCAGVNPCVIRQQSNTARVDAIKEKIKNNNPLTWYEQIASKAHIAAAQTGELFSSLPEMASKPNPKVTAEIKNKICGHRKAACEETRHSQQKTDEQCASLTKEQHRISSISKAAHSKA